MTDIKYYLDEDACSVTCFSDFTALDNNNNEEDCRPSMRRSVSDSILFTSRRKQNRKRRHLVNLIKNGEHRIEQIHQTLIPLKLQIKQQCGVLSCLEETTHTEEASSRRNSLKKQADAMAAEKIKLMSAIDYLQEQVIDLQIKVDEARGYSIPFLLTPFGEIKQTVDDMLSGKTDESATLGFNVAEVEWRLSHHKRRRFLMRRQSLVCG